MPVIPEAVIEDVRARTDIVQVIGDRVPLKRAGAAWKACCPFHREKTPSFTVNPQRQSFKCFGCGEGGDVFKFLMKHDGMSFLDAVRHLAEKCGVEVVAEKDDGRTARFFGPPGVLMGLFLHVYNGWLHHSRPFDEAVLCQRGNVLWLYLACRHGAQGNARCAVMNYNVLTTEQRKQFEQYEEI